MSPHEGVLHQFAISADGDVDPDTGHIQVWASVTHLMCGEPLWGDGGDELVLRADRLFQLMYDHRCKETSDG